MRLAAAAGVALTLLFSACTGSGDGASVGIGLSDTETATAAPSAPASSPTIEGTVSTPSLVPTPSPTLVSTLTRTGPRGHPMDSLGGAPISGADFGRVLEEQSLMVVPVSTHAECDRLGWPRSACSAYPAGERTQVLLLLWVYPDRDALQDDWVAEPGSSPVLADDGCTIASGWRYWNENLVLVIGAVADETLRQEVVDAFLGLTP